MRIHIAVMAREGRHAVDFQNIRAFKLRFIKHVAEEKGELTGLEIDVAIFVCVVGLNAQGHTAAVTDRDITFSTGPENGWR